jgi:hypothetical protein
VRKDYGVLGRTTMFSNMVVVHATMEYRLSITNGSPMKAE